MRNRFIIFVTAILSVFLLCCCAEKTQGSEKLKVVATLFPQYDFAMAIGGDKIDVVKLLPYGSESHTYDPSVKDITEISTADIFLYTGEHMEKWAGGLIKDAENSGLTVVDLSDGITLLSAYDETGHSESTTHKHDYDAHIWTSPKNAKIMVDSILYAFCLADSENAEYYRQNASVLKSEIDALDSELREISENYGGETLYFGGRFAFLYMFREYGFNYRTPYKGCGEESEPGIKVISEIVSQMKESTAQYIFCEEMSEGKVAKSMAEETGAKILVLHSCHNISKQEADSGETYISIMKKNIDNLRCALGAI